MPDPTEPLHDLALEENVLSGCMQNTEACWLAMSFDLDPEDFYLEAHRIIWSAIEDIGSNGSGRADEVSIVQWLRNQKLLEQAGGPVAVARITDTYPSPAAMEDHVAILKELRRSREIRYMCMNVLQQESTQAQMQQLDEGFARIMSVAHERHTETVAAAANRFKVDDLGEAVDYDIFPRLNNKIRFRRGALYVLGATPGTGKTSLALQIAANISRDHPVLIASAEMRMREIIERYVAMQTEFGPEVLHSPTSVQRDTIQSAADMLKKHTQLTVMEPGFITPPKVAGRARIEGMKNGRLGLIVADYLQLFTLPRAGRMNREQVVGEMARQFKEMAQTLDVPVLLLSQLSREHKKSKRPPDLHDLRESGSIESHADAVFFLDRGDEEEETIIYIRKNRHGVRGRGRLCFCTGARFKEYNL